MLFAPDAFKTRQHLVGLFFLFFIASCGNDDGEAVNSSNNPDDSASDKYGMSLIWSDEFDYDGSVDNLKWHHQVIPIMGSSWANGEVQHYTDRTQNSFVSDGTLKIVAKKEQYQFNGNTKSYTSEFKVYFSIWAYRYQCQTSCRSRNMACLLDFRRKYQ
jgi:hypothetical protein